MGELRLFDGTQAASIRESCELIRAAVAHAECGGQALHLHVWCAPPSAPRCFRRSRLMAHLFDRDRARLVATALFLGVRRIAVDRDGTDAQHIDLCGRPLGRALAMAKGVLTDVRLPFPDR